jgi:hypothetical protein
MTIEFYDWQIYFLQGTQSLRTNSSSASQEIPTFYGIQKFIHYQLQLFVFWARSVQILLEEPF